MALVVITTRAWRVVQLHDLRQELRKNNGIIAVDVVWSCTVNSSEWKRNIQRDKGERKAKRNCSGWLRHYDVTAHLSNGRLPLALRSSAALSWRGSRTPGTKPPRYQSLWRWSASPVVGVSAESSPGCVVAVRRLSASSPGEAGETQRLLDVNSCWSNGRFACSQKQSLLS